MSEIFKLSFNPTAIIVNELPLSNWTIVNTNTLSINGDTVTQLGVGGWYESMFVSFTVPETGSYKISYDYNITKAKVGNHGTYGFGLWLTTNNPNVTGDAQYNFYMDSNNHTGGNIGSKGEDISGKSGTISFITTLNAGTTYYLWYPGAALDDGTTYTLSFTNLCVYNNPIQYTYNNTLSYPSWNGFLAFDTTPVQVPRNVILTQQTGGTITANPMSGYDGDVVTLSNTTASNYYTFSNYSLTGATLTGNQFAFTGTDVTAKANFNLQTSVNVYSNTAYNVTRTPSNNGALTINAAAPTAYYKIFALKWQEHWGGGGSLYEMGIHTISNNYDFWECLCKPVPKTACPLWHKSGRTTFPGNYSNCTFTAQSRYNDAFLYKAQSNASFYTRKLIYNNNNNTISGYLNNTFMFQVTGVGAFTSMNSFTYGGNKSYPATAYVKDVRLYAFANASDAISW